MEMISLPPDMNRDSLVESKIIEPETLSLEVQDIIGRSPGWLLRAGSVIIFILVFLLIGGAFFISYPEKISADIVLTTTFPPINVVAGTDGEIASIFTKNNQNVRRGEVLASIYDGANQNDVRKLRTFIDGDIFTKGLNELSDLRLGELSSTAFQFIDSRKKLDLFLKLDIIGSQLESLKSKIVGNRILAGHQSEQCQLMKREEQLVSAGFARNTNLFENKVLSVQEFEVHEREYLGFKKAQVIAEQGLSATNLEISSLEMTSRELVLQRELERAKLEQTVAQNAEILRSAILQWQEKFLLISNIDGSVNFIDHWSSGQYIKKGEAIFSIDPGRLDVVGKLKVSVVNSGKIRDGQLVHIKLDNFPYEQYGMVIGKVKSITTIPNDKLYLIDVEIPNGLKTTYNKILPYHPQISGKADIITEELSLFDRFFYQFRKLYYTI
jgi:multidrug resistance efflux pump